MRTRDQAIVAEISARATLLTAAAGSRYVVSLPGLLQRHGLLQTLAFLLRKAAAADGGEAAGNAALIQLLELGIRASSEMPEVRLGDEGALKRLAAEPLAIYLHLSETALVTATWIKRLSEAAAAVARAERQRASSGGAP